MRSRLAIGSAVTVTAALLAGCNMPGTVATVDGERITSRELAEASEIRNHLMIQPGTTGQMLTLQTLNLMVLTPFLEEVAIEYGVEVSDQEAIEVVNQTITGLGGTEWAAADFSETQLDFVRSMVVLNRADQSPDAQAIFEDLTAAVTRADIEVNPRYGEVDPNGNIMPSTRPWIEGYQSAAVG